MQSDWQQQLRQIETATTPELSSDAKMDAETVELREGWTALVRLLDEADQSSPIPELTLPRPANRFRRALTLAALAAAVLVAATVAWRLVGRFDAPGTDVVVEIPGESVPQRSPTEHDGSPTEPNAGVGSNVLVADDSWDDGLDERLDDLTQQIAGIQGNGLLLDSPFQSLDERIGELRDKMDDL
ncbi:MAG: hypothetical protein KJ000_25825 [Pirellulaceae bacterium]|nr:hypothetical protein [Pirellulaceae bacterium]